MGKLKADIAISVDGYVAGPNQSEDHPIGEGGDQLHEWKFALAAFRDLRGEEGGQVNESTPFVEEMFQNVGAVIMGRNMFGRSAAIGGPRSGRAGGATTLPTTCPSSFSPITSATSLRSRAARPFHFVTDGIESALERASEAAGEKDVMVAGGASAIRQYLAAGLVEEILLHVVPVVLGAGERLFEEVGELNLEQLRAVEAPGVAHLEYRVVR
jgi:dihydrofolate reductase